MRKNITLVKYLFFDIENLTIRRYPARGHCLVGSLSGADSC
jgi:hypothetical protein